MQVRARRLRHLAVFGLALLGACSKEPVELATTAYVKGPGPTCAAGERLGGGGVHDREKTNGGTRYSVRTPANYDPTIAHPLLLVYAGAGHSRHASERFTGLTHVATAAGFVIAYADHRRLSIKTLDDLATIPGAITEKWCINPERVYLTGHSDGGTAAAALAFRTDDGLRPAGIAPSAAGVRREDLTAYQCPEHLGVMILHNRDDELFPGFGADAARWWANCNACDNAIPVEHVDGCVDYGECADNGNVRYCEGAGGHRRWPALNGAMIEFFLSN